MKPLNHNRLFDSTPLLGLGLKVLGMGKLVKPHPKCNNLTRSLPFFQFYLVSEGRGILQVEDGPVYTIEAGNIFMLLPNVTYTYGPGDHEWKEYWMYIDGNLMRDLNTQKTFGEAYNAKQCENLKDLVKNWERCIALVDEDVSAEAEVTSLIYSMLSISYPTPRRKTPSGIASILKSIDADPIKNWDFEEFAKEQSMSYSRLRQIFSEHVGSPPATYLRYKRMQFAAQLMIEGKSSKETCYAIGMEDPHHFSRLFKQVMGESPRNWLKSWVSEE